MRSRTTVLRDRDDWFGSHDAGPAPVMRPDNPPSDEERLESAIAGLSLLTFDPLTLEEVLIGVARLCEQAVEGANGAGVRLLGAARRDGVVAVTEPVRELVAVQDQSALSVPLLLAGQVLGTISVYAEERGAFTDRAATATERFARSAAITVRNAQLLARAQHRSCSWQTSDPTRHLIDEALDVIMSRTGATPRQAFERLHLMSQRAHRTVSAVAAQVVDETHELTCGSRRPPG